MNNRSIVTPLNCIDKVLLSYDSAHQPMTFHLILSVEGEVDSVRLNEALLSVLRFYPAMRTTVRTRRLGHVRQVHEDFGNEVLEVCDLVDSGSARRSGGAETKSEYEMCLFEWMNRPLDVQKEFPFRVLMLTRRRAESTLVFTFHHSAIDGLSAVRILDDVISIYDNGTPGRFGLSCAIPAHRNGDELLGLARAERPAARHFYRRMLSYMFHFLLTTPFCHSTRIFHNRSRMSADTQYCSLRVDSGRLQRIKSGSRSNGVTINDVLLATCFKTIDKWNRLHGKQSKKLSIMVPVDISSSELRPAAGNQISFISVPTGPEDRTESARLLKTVSVKTASALKKSRGNTFSYVYFSYGLSFLPLAAMKAFARFVKFPIYADTVLHSNLGIVKLGDDGEEKGSNNLRIADFTALGPVVNVMGMFLCASTYNGTLGVDLCYKTSAFSKEKAQEFLDLYLEEMDKFRDELGTDQSVTAIASPKVLSPV